MDPLTHYCELCGKRFNLDSDQITLEELKVLRLVLAHDKYWHIPCTQMRLVDGSIDINEGSRGWLCKPSFGCTTTG